MRIVDYLFGRITFCIPQKHYRPLFDILRQSGANYEHLTLQDNEVCFSCPRRDGNKLKTLFNLHEIPFRIEKEQGLYLLLRRSRTRPGFYLGLILFLLCLFLSTQFVFDIRIIGNEVLTDREILAELEKQGFAPGSYLPNIDIEVLCNRIPLQSDNISWISVNMLGNIAFVQIREKREAEYTEPETGLSALVAERDGVIVGFDCTTGTIAVNVGETVRAGQVLVNGVTDTAIGSYFGNAAGAVRARTIRTFTAIIPKNEDVTVGYTRTKIEKSIIFLGKSIKLFTKGGNLPSSCDTIKSESKQLSLSPDLLLPVFIKTTYHEMPVLENVTHSEEEALRLATEEINEKIAALSQCRILSSSIEWTENQDSYTLTKKITCIENIAKKVPIQTN